MPKISQTRKLFMKVCANYTLSLQIFPFSSVLVKGGLFLAFFPMPRAARGRNFFSLRSRFYVENLVLFGLPMLYSDPEYATIYNRYLSLWELP